jgi:hypothetical protein
MGEAGPVLSLYFLCFPGTTRLGGYILTSSGASVSTQRRLYLSFIFSASRVEPRILTGPIHTLFVSSVQYPPLRPAIPLHAYHSL